jgi:hypothetical protein
MSNEASIALVFNEVADKALLTMRTAAEELNIKGVAVVAYCGGDSVTSWSSRMLVVGAMKRLQSDTHPGSNFVAIAYSKVAEMADTLQASGHGARPPMKGELGYAGGLVMRGKAGYLMAAFSGAKSEDDVKVSQAGLDIMATAL